MATVSSTDGGATYTGWKRLSSAGSFSMCLRYSSSVVAPDHPQLASRERRLEHVPRVHGSLRRPGAHDRVHLVDEDHIATLRFRDLLEHGLHALLELATVLRSREHGRDVELEQLLVGESEVGTSPFDHTLSEPLDDGRLADTPGSPMRTGLFLVRRARTLMTRRISSSRPMTGSSFPRYAPDPSGRVNSAPAPDSAPRGSGPSPDGSRAPPPAPREPLIGSRPRHEGCGPRRRSHP